MAIPERDLHLAHTARELKVTPHLRGAFAEADQLRDLLCAQRAQRGEEVAGLEEVGLALAILAGQDGGSRRHHHRPRLEVAEALGGDIEEENRATPSRTCRWERPHRRSCTGTSAGSAAAASSSAGSSAAAPLGAAQGPPCSFPP